MNITQDVRYGRIYFINGPAPKHYSVRNDISDGPSGWAMAYVVPGPHIFVPSTGEGWDVDENCLELQEILDPVEELNYPEMADRVRRAVNTRKSHGLPHDLDGANIVLKALGADPLEDDRVQPEKKPAKQAKTPKASREGLKTIKDVEKETGLKGRIIRGFLRQAGMKKPDIGWAGDEKWYKEVLKVVEETRE